MPKPLRILAWCGVLLSCQCYPVPGGPDAGPPLDPAACLEMPADQARRHLFQAIRQFQGLELDATVTEHGTRGLQRRAWEVRLARPLAGYFRSYSLEIGDASDWSRAVNGDEVVHVDHATGTYTAGYGHDLASLMLAPFELLRVWSGERPRPVARVEWSDETPPQPGLRGLHVVYDYREDCSFWAWDVNREVYWLDTAGMPCALTGYHDGKQQKYVLSVNIQNLILRPRVAPAMYPTATPPGPQHEAFDYCCSFGAEPDCVIGGF
ncbi:MAG: hypothetical protein EYC70_11145 [Planctomycetota bacterium]|nr:MAG: hypothetical protein EYC70_11145 [Planctomycetota bacterium]